MRFSMMMTIVIPLSAGVTAGHGADDPRQTDEYRLLEKIVSAYRAGRPHEARPYLTTVGKNLADRLVPLAWVEAFEYTPLDIRRDVPGGLFGGRHNELRFRAAGSGQQFFFLVTYFHEGGQLRAHDAFVEEPVFRFLSERPGLPEIRCVAAARKLKESAKALASEPSDWRGGAKQMADFREAAVTLGWLDRPVVKRFLAAGDDSVGFATTWRQTIEAVMTDKSAGERRKEIAAAIRAGLSTRDIGGAIEANAAKVEKVAEEISHSVGRRIERLSPDQTVEFVKRQKRLNEAYEEVLQLVSESRLLIESAKSSR